MTDLARIITNDKYGIYKLKQSTFDMMHSMCFIKDL